MEMRERVVVKEGERWNERLALKRCKSPRERLRFQLICISNEEGEWKRDRCDEEKLRERDGEVVKTAAAERDGWQIEEKVQTDESHITSRLETHKEQHGGKRERYSRGLMLNYKTFILLEVFIVAFLVVFFLNHVFGSTEKSDWWLAHRRKRKLNWPTFVTKLVAGTLITTTSDHLEKIQQPFKRKRVNVGQPGTTAGSVGLFIHNKSTPACSNRRYKHWNVSSFRKRHSLIKKVVLSWVTHPVLY